MTDLLSLRYVPISEAELLEDNAKLHDLDKIIQSITRYGFKSACKWEGTLNDGRGGIGAGNGRIEALRVMEERGDDLPVGIAQDTDTGEWCVPVLFGVEASSEAVARAYAYDDNNLTLLGGDFALADLAKLYDQELLTAELKELAQSGDLPVTFDNDFTEDALQLLAENDSTDDNDEDSERPTSTKEIDTNDYKFQHRCPKCQFEFND